MDDHELAARVAELCDGDGEAFEERVREEAEDLKEAVAEGAFDNSQALVGLEYEFVGVDYDGRLRRIPPFVVDHVGFEREVGKHQLELCTSPQPLNRHGLEAQEAELRARITQARRALTTEGIQLVSDGIWVAPPTSESAGEYLLAAETRQGVTLAKNISEDPRYHVQDNSDYDAARRIDAPHVREVEGTVLLNSLCTSIQPHYQVPVAANVPEYFRYALRLAGPLLALGANSPFFPPDLYEDDVDAESVFDANWMENRVIVFESVMNPEDGEGSVRFPRDVESVYEAVDRIVEDDPVVPRSVNVGERFDDQFAHYRHKHGSYWRWVRPVFDGATRSKANARIELRPLPSQPTVNDTASFLAVFAGLLEALYDADHPVRDQSWEVARENFYVAARDGLRADLRWIDADGEETTDRAEIFDELFEFARRGLESCGLSASQAERHVRPLRVRVSRGVTPARWKQNAVRERVESGSSLADALEATHAEYVRRQADTFVDGDFTEWLTG